MRTLYDIILNKKKKITVKATVEKVSIHKGITAVDLSVVKINLRFYTKNNN